MSSRKAKVVCRACNNGWMSRWEDAAKPLVERLVEGGGAVRLSADDASRLARWGMLKSLMMETTRHTTVCSAPVDFYHVYNKREPPQTCTVTPVTLADVPPWQVHFYHRGARLTASAGLPQINLSTVGFMVGRAGFVVQNRGAEHPAPDAMREVRPEAGVRLWPIEPDRPEVTFPLTHAFPFETFRELVERHPRRLVSAMREVLANLDAGM